MTWRGRLTWAWLAAVALACGCLTKSATLKALPPLPTDLSSSDRPEVARSQKPDTTQHDDPSICLISLPVERPAEASQAHATAGIRAVVNGEPILDEEVFLASLFSGQFYTARSPKEREEVLHQGLVTLIERELLLQDAMGKLEKGGKQGAKFLEKIREEAREDFEKRFLKRTMQEKKITNRQEYEELFLKQTGLPLDTMRRYWERNFMATLYLRGFVEPHISRIGHTEISEYYNSHRDEYVQPDTMEWQDIFIDARQHASRDAARRFVEGLAKRVRDGEDFAKLSMEFDNGAAGRFRKGDGEGRKRGEIRPVEAEPVLLRLHEGEMDIVELHHGFHLIRLVKRQYAGPIPFDAKVQKEIRDKLRNKVFLSERESKVKELKRKAVIDISTRHE